VIETTIKELDRQVIAIVANDERAKLIDTIPVVAPYTTLFLSFIPDGIDMFPDPKHACAYLALASRLD
jgi:transposase